MSLTDGLILHFVPEGNRPESGRIIFKDGSGSAYPALTNQNVVLAQDPMLGLTLKFSGADSFLEINHPNFNIPGDFTIGGWFKFYADSGWVRLIGKGLAGAGSESIGLWAKPDVNIWWISQQGTIPYVSVDHFGKDIAPGIWYHITAVRQNDTLTLYYNTEVLSTKNGIAGAPQALPSPLRIGYNGEQEGFNGEMAHLRIYRRALSAGEINQMINASGVAVLPPAAVWSGAPVGDAPGSAFKRSHPVEFALFDPYNHYACYIDDGGGAGQPLTFEVHNISDRAISLINQGTAASGSNYHFELRFRPGILSANTLSRLRDPQRKAEIVTDPANWDLFVPAETGPAESISLYLLHKGDPQWQPNTRRSLRLSGISAAAAGGARGTQVAMITNQLRFAGSEDPLSGRRTRHLSIINQSGAQNTSLHVGFKGSNQVMNVKGAESNLIVQIVNNLRLAQTHADMPAVLLNAAKPPQPASRFVIEFDVQQEGEDKPWALARANELSKLTVTASVIRRGASTADSDAVLLVRSDILALSPRWEITPKQDMALNPGDIIQVSLSGIVSSLPAGPTSLYVHYDHVSGNQGGRFDLPVLKSPLAFAGHQVGIGTATPTAGLTINKGETNETALLATSSGPGWGSGIRLANTAPNGRDYGIYVDQQGILRFADNGANTDRIVVFKSGAVGMGTAYSAAIGAMVAGSLTIGLTSQNYGGNTAQWNNGNVAGLMLECAANTEIAVHDSSDRLASLLYYEGDAVNRITIGRNMGWGVTSVHIPGNLSVEGGLSKKYRRWWSLEIENDQDWGTTRIGLITGARWSNSDVRLKEEISPLTGALQKIAQLNGVTYKWSPEGLRYLTNDIDHTIFAGPEATEAENRKAREEARKEAYQLLGRTEVGLLAQDVEKVLPQLVKTGEDGYKSIRYDLLTALLVEAVKELQAEHQAVRQQLAAVLSINNHLPS